GIGIPHHYASGVVVVDSCVAFARCHVQRRRATSRSSTRRLTSGGVSRLINLSPSLARRVLRKSGKVCGREQQCHWVDFSKMIEFCGGDSIGAMNAAPRSEKESQHWRQ